LQFFHAQAHVAFAFGCGVEFAGPVVDFVARFVVFSGVAGLLQEFGAGFGEIAGLRKCRR
jgi:hypothetical protein